MNASSCHSSLFFIIFKLFFDATLLIRWEISFNEQFRLEVFSKLCAQSVEANLLNVNSHSFFINLFYCKIADLQYCINFCYIVK